MIRNGVRDGATAPGERLVANDIALALKLSPTPVRQALALLSGAGLLEARPGVGYFARALGVEDLEDLYGASQLLLVAGAKLGLSRRAVTPLTPAPGLSDPAALAQRAEEVLRALMQEGASPVLMETFAMISDRLAIARQAEPYIIDDAANELEQLAAAIGQAQAPHLALRYFDRRRRMARPIIQQIRRAVAARPALNDPGGSGRSG